jgi:hypothetical protein
MASEVGIPITSFVALSLLDNNQLNLPCFTTNSTDKKFLTQKNVVAELRGSNYFVNSNSLEESNTAPIFVNHHSCGGTLSLGQGILLGEEILAMGTNNDFRLRL